MPSSRSTTVRRPRGVVLAALVALTLLALPVAAAPSTSGEAASFAQTATQRVEGPERISTAVAISQRAFPDGAAATYLARADVFADALAAGVLPDGPILLVPSCGPVPAVVSAEVQRLSPATVVGLGGTAAVCDELLAQAAQGRDIARLAGNSRFATAAAIATHTYPGGADVVYLANADDSPDAVAGGVLHDGPILLVPGDGSVHADVTAALDALDPDTVTALGGTAAISDAQLDATAEGRPTSRLAGDSRYATAAAIGAHAFPQGATTAYLANAATFADAIAGGVLTDGPILLVDACGPLPAPTAAQLTATSPGTVVALGGVNAICDQVLADAAAAAGSDPGPDPDPDPTEPPPAEGGGVIYANWSGDRAYRYDLTVEDPTWEAQFFTGQVEYSDIAPGTNEWVGTSEGAWIERNLVTFWDLDTQVENETLVWPDSGADPERRIKFDGLSVSQDGQLVAGVVNEFILDPHLEVVRRSDGEILGRGFDTNDGVYGVTAMEWTPDGDLLLGTHVRDPSTDEEFPAIRRLPAEAIAGETPYEQVSELLWVFTDPGMATVAWLAVSHDASELAFVERGNIYVVDLQAQAEPRQLTTGFFAAGSLRRPGWTAQFSPDGSQLAIANRVHQQFIIPNHDGTPLNMELAENEDRYQVGRELADRIIGWLP